MSTGRPVSELTRHLDGCVGRNHAQDVLDVMDALEIDFMPLVDDFSGGKLLGVITRWELARVLARLGPEARVAHGCAAQLPKVREDTAAGQVAAVAGEATAYVVVDEEDRLKGIYRPSMRR